MIKRIEYIEISANDVFATFAKDFSLKDPTEIVSTDLRPQWFYDAQKNIVVFKLYVEEKKA